MTTISPAVIRNIRMAMLHNEALKMDRARDVAIAKHGTGMVCHYSYGAKADGTPFSVLESSK